MEKYVKLGFCEPCSDKLAKEGKVVYSSKGEHGNGWFDHTWSSVSHKALLIDIQPIVKCDHPKEKVRWLIGKEYICGNCETKVRPDHFSEK